MTFVEKDIGNYIVYSNGDIFSKRSNKFLKINYNTTHSYARVSIDGKTIKLHRLIIETFLGKSELEVNHIDGNKRNNSLSNLEYVSRSQNVKHAYDNGLVPRHKTSNKSVKLVIKGKKIGTFDSGSSLSLLLGKNRQWLGNQLHKKEIVKYGDFSIMYDNEEESINGTNI
ncbi:HNH endonuclease signature motif containing protein [Streptomyces sp. TRM76323]|uniref:HNH endonuclease signature motif containing protein n=1 Tax=Streptomyces tamarix TaxID=3078565 RepID=A0ABU3QLG8_9ACTN|nr:HNH endonuclease signature motif containing protein [Streptomyces tamarix]MDT9683471.1 HNH endonuclease signature motif containing protein [Streptomyces tamarix]